MTLGEKIQYGRKKENININDFAELLNISIEEVNDYESNLKVPDIPMLIKISNILELSLDYLLKDSKIEDNKSNQSLNSNESKKKQSIKKKKLTTIKCLLVAEILIRTIIATFWGFAINLQFGWIAGIIVIFVSIPIAIHSANKIKKSSRKMDFLAESIIVLLFTGLISGIFMLCIKDDDYTYLN